MTLNVAKEVAALERLAVADLRHKYAEVFGEPARTNNRVWLVKRIAWRLQALAEGDLSERARQRAAELACDADLRTTVPKDRPAPTAVPLMHPRAKVLRLAEDHRLPPPGSLITRVYKGEQLQVQVLPDGFLFQGGVYRSLSAVAKAITGSHCNGFLFFKLNGGDQ